MPRRPTPHLRPYQAQVVTAVARAVAAGDGGTYTCMMARQSGKNETSAYLERVLLTLHHAERRTGIKAAPTLVPQAQISRTRLMKFLAADAFRQWTRERDHFVYFAKARWAFLSAGREANVVGLTCDILLEADEAQDIDPAKWQKDFRPMSATTNAPAIYWGTPWTDDSLLALAIAANEEAGHPERNFRVPWTVTAEHNPKYAAYVEGERARLGANHPLFLTQYELQTLSGAGRLLSPAQLAALNGGHAREEGPGTNATYVAGVDVAGEDTSAPLRGRDSTVMYVGRVIWKAVREPPDVDIVQVYAWTGAPHDQLYAQIATLAHRWGCKRVAVDATALGEALALYLRRELGDEKVIGYRFTELSKSNLGYALQAAAATGRLSVWANDQSADRVRLFTQLRLCRAEYKPNRAMRWSVAESDGHDDDVCALALCNHAAEQCPPRAIARGRLMPA